MISNIAPKSMVTFGLITIAFLLVINLYIALQAPALGIVWEANKQGELFVAKVMPNSPAQQAGIAKGLVIISIGTHDTSEPLSAISFTEEPDNLEDYKSANEFYKHQQNISTILNQGTLWLEAKDGQRFHMASAKRKISWLPAMYWFQLVCGLLSFVAGLAVFSFRSQDTASRVYLMNGYSFTIVTFAAAIYSGRELAISSDLFQVLSALNHFGSLWFTATFIALAWYVPKRLNAFSLTRVLLMVYTFFGIADTLRWQTGSPELWLHLPILTGLVLSLIIAVMQWRRCKQQPDDKQALRWLLLSLMIPGILFLLLTIVSQWLNIELVIPQGYAFGMLLVMYLGISLGVIRFALFELDRWWASIWLWLLTGSFFIITDIALAALLHWSEIFSTLFALAIVAFIYIPMRQWLFTHILKAKEISLESLIPEVLGLVSYANHSQKLEQQWQILLQNAFSPLSIKEEPHRLSEGVSMLNNGVSLYIPNIGIGSSLRLEYPNNGARLFSKADIALVTSLVYMVQKALNDTLAYNKGISEERKRMAEDLHDDLGAKLLSIVYKSETSEQKKLAREAMGVLREVISANQEKECLLLEQALAWKEECFQRTQEKNISLEWRQYGINPRQSIAVNTSIQLSKVLREGLSNALKHGDAKEICIRVHVRGDFLLMSIRNNDRVLCDFQSNGYGISNMKRRIDNIGGVIRWVGRKHGGCHIAWISPMLDVGFNDA